MNDISEVIINVIKEGLEQDPDFVLSQIIAVLVIGAMVQLAIQHFMLYIKRKKYKAEKFNLQYTILCLLLICWTVFQTPLTRLILSNQQVRELIRPLIQTFVFLSIMKNNVFISWISFFCVTGFFLIQFLCI